MHAFCWGIGVRLRTVGHSIHTELISNIDDLLSDDPLVIVGLESCLVEEWTCLVSCESERSAEVWIWTNLSIWWYVSCVLVVFTSPTALVACPPWKRHNGSILQTRGLGFRLRFTPCLLYCPLIESSHRVFQWMDGAMRWAPSSGNPSTRHYRDGASSVVFVFSKNNRLNI